MAVLDLSCNESELFDVFLSLLEYGPERMRTSRHSGMAWSPPGVRARMGRNKVVVWRAVEYKVLGSDRTVPGDDP